MAQGTLVGGQSVYGNGTTTATGGANTIVHFYDRAGIKAANAKSIYTQFVDKKSMPTKMGKTFKISKWQHIYDLAEDNADFAAKGYLGKRDLASVTTNLANSGTAGTIAEGAGAVNQVTPVKITVETSLDRYGFMIPYVDEVELFSEEKIQTHYREELGYLMNEAAEDLIQRDMISGAGVIVNAGGDITKAQMGTGVGVDDTGAEAYKVSFDVLRKSVKALVRNRAKKHTSVVTGSTKISTTPVNSAYYAIIGPEVKFDLETITRGSTYEKEFAYIPAYKYASQGNLAEGECGQVHDLKFIESEKQFMEPAAGAVIPSGYTGNLSYSNDGSNDRFDLFPILIPTAGAFATVGLKGKGKVVFHAMSPEQALSTTNPYATQGFFSANMWYSSIVLQPEKLAVINVMATA